MNKLDACLVLGCNGHSGNDGFMTCTGVSNIIINLKDVDDDSYDKLVNFLEGACSLLDEPMYNRNKIANSLNIIHRDHGIIPHTMLFNIQNFMQMHRKCGHYMLLIMREDYNNYGR